MKATKTTSTLRHLLGLAALALPLAGCMTDDRAPTDLDVPTPGASTAAPTVAPELHLLRSYTPSTEVRDDVDVPVIADDAAAPRAHDPVLDRFDGGEPGRFGVMYVDLANHAEYVATYDQAAMDAAAKELIRLGYQHASKGAATDDLADGGEIANGWSNNLDNRISFESYSDTHSTLRRIGRVSSSAGGCTGAMFGPRVVLTAAHCIFDSGGNYLANITFQARRNGADLPYGSVVSQGAVYPISYKNDGCNFNETNSCVRNDWAILILPPDPFAGSPNGHPGYLGVWWADDDTVEGFAPRNVGYPGCSNGMPPAGCVSNVAYGDLSCAGVAPSLSSPDSRWPLYGTNGRMDTGCDGSPGHSGGPIYSYSPGSSGPYLIGNATWNTCWLGGCTASSQYSMGGVRISETLAGYMMNLRATYQ
jgi:hypothetical protein